MIPDDTILAVFGTTRSGTSVLMRKLDALHIPVAHDDKPPITVDDDRREAIDEIVRELNPDGFYEVDELKGRGLFSPRLLRRFDLSGKALKLLGPAMLPADGVSPRGTDYRLISKIIICLRNPREVAMSQRKLRVGPMVADGDEWSGRIPGALSPDVYIRDLGRLCIHLAEHNDIPVFVVDYAKWYDPEDRAAQLQALAEFVGVKVTPEAQAVWDDKQYRSRMEEWPARLAETGALAEAIHDAILNADYASVVPRVNAWAATQALEHAAWYDGDRGYKTHTMLNPGAWRQLTANERGCRDALRDNALLRLKAGANSKSCPHRINVPDVRMVQVPPDLTGPGISTVDGKRVVTLPLVGCAEDRDRKLEAVCQRCWTHGIARTDDPARSAPMSVQVENAKRKDRP